MKKILFILFFIASYTLLGQQKTIYFNKHWEKTTKERAVYYRLMPLEKVGDLYHVKDYYSNGTLQMEGFWSNLEKETLEGDIAWYYKDGTLSETAHYQNGKKEGLCKTYIKNGNLKTTGIYKKGKPLDGTFPAYCAMCNVSEYKEGKEITTYRYYMNTVIIAEKIFLENRKSTRGIYYNNKGEQIGEVTMGFYQSAIDGKEVWFNIDNDKHILNIGGYSHYKNKILQGETAHFDEKGKLLAKGIYKNGTPENGTFISNLDDTIKTYVNGITEGIEILYSEKGKLLATGINKNGKHWSGNFFGYYDGLYPIIHYENGEVAGKQTRYYSRKYEKIAETYHLEKQEKSGKTSSYNKEGKQLAKGIYKNDKQWDGTFYDAYYHTLTSYKKGKKHGTFISYSSSGDILDQQEYENGKIGGNNVTTGYFKSKKCNCIYKEGKPYTGKVCESTTVKEYKKGNLIKQMRYVDESATVLESISLYKKGILSQQTNYVKDKVYTITYKGGKEFTGKKYSTYDGTFYSYKEGVLDGEFLKNSYYTTIYI